MFAKIVENPAFEPKSIILAIEEKFKYWTRGRASFSGGRWARWS
jgi:hypothetical protein